tara:strand:+ start:899 stop:1048 length:150 start_codon:yes stop_codon:yes gene_type:complete
VNVYIEVRAMHSKNQNHMLETLKNNNSNNITHEEEPTPNIVIVTRDGIA